MAAFMVTAMLAGCSSKAADSTTRSNSGSAAAAKSATLNAAVGDSYYYAEESQASYEDIDWAYETTAAAERSDAEAPEDYSDYQSDSGNGSTSTANADKKVDISKEMLVFRCSISLDTTDFEQSVSLLKTKIAEYHGFVERENQTDGSRSSGRYVIDEKDKDYYYTATIRIPSEYYESFVSSAEGIGILRSKNSSVDNVATRYGTLKNELQIYEAEYDRYLKQYEETKDEKIALQIQSELRRMALTISDLKTEMSMLESDVAYSYITLTIHKVTQKELDEQQQQQEETEPEEETFSMRVSAAAKDSWNEFLCFLESILMFFIANWWVLSILLIIGLIVFFILRHVVKKHKKKTAKQAEELKQRQEAYLAAKYGNNQAPAAKTETQPSAPRASAPQTSIKAQVRAANAAKVETDDKTNAASEEKKADAETKADETSKVDESNAKTVDEANANAEAKSDDKSDAIDEKKDDKKDDAEK